MRLRLYNYIGSCVAAVAALCLGSVVGSASEPDPRQVFLQQYEPHAAELLSRYSNIRVRYRVTAPQGPTREQRMTVSGKFDFENYLLTGEDDRVVDLTTGNATPRGRAIQVRNARYAFTLADKGQGRYLLADTDLYTEGRQAERCMLCFPFAEAGWGRTYLELAQNPDTTVLGCREVEWRGQRVVELRLECSFYHRGEKRTMRGPGVYYFAPAAGWVCVGERTIPRNPAKSTEYVERVYTYNTSGDWAVPTRMELWELDERKPEVNNRLRVTEIDEFVPIPKLDPAEFRLTAFGLPEPVGVVWEKPTPRYVWFLLAAGGFAALMLGFRYLARRRSSKTPVPA